jgi:hypothetical protein
MLVYSSVEKTVQASTSVEQFLVSYNFMRSVHS